MSWFGSLGLAWKYALVFGTMLTVTLVAGFIKLLFDRQRMKKLVAKLEVEAGAKNNDHSEVPMREKDEGDLFGVRAIEAGYYGGVAQSRPGSIMSSRPQSRAETTASKTATDPFQTPKMKSTSISSSMSDLRIVRQDTEGSQTTLATIPNPQRSPPRTARISGPQTKSLRPSEAELSGRLNHNPAINMSLNVPPSPSASRTPSPIQSAYEGWSPEPSPQFETFSSNDHDMHDQYQPMPAQLVLPEHVAKPGFGAAHNVKSERASIVSKHSTPPSPPLPPVAVPALPSKSYLDAKYSQYNNLNNAFAQPESSSLDNRPSTSHSAKDHANTDGA